MSFIILIFLLVCVVLSYILLKKCRTENLFILLMLFVFCIVGIIGVLRFFSVKGLEKRLESNIYVCSLDEMIASYAKDLKEKHPFAEDYDIIHFSKRSDLSIFEEFISNFYLSSEFYNYTIESNTGVLDLNGSDMVQAKDVVEHYGARGSIYYTNSWYIRYDNKFYKIENELDIDDTKKYLIKYSISSKSTIGDLTGTYDCYNSCTVYEFKD